MPRGAAWLLVVLGLTAAAPACKRDTALAPTAAPSAPSAPSTPSAGPAGSAAPTGSAAPAGSAGSAAPANSAALIGEDSAGCLAWNPTKRHALCALGSVSIQQGSDLHAVELGGRDDFPWLDIEAGTEAQPYPGAAMAMKPSSATLSRARALVARDELNALADTHAIALEPGKRFGPGGSTLELLVTVKQPASVDDAVEARLEVMCAGRKKRTLFTDKRIGMSTDASVYAAPGVAFVVWSVSWGFEGEGGRATNAAFIDLAHEACGP